MKQVTCIDLSGNTFQAPLNKLSFRPAVYGVVIKNNKLLLSKQSDGYNFPGGGIDIGETIEEALRREFKEETGLNVSIGNIITCQDCFFKLPYKDKFVQSILIYYLCKVAGGKISASFLRGYEKEHAQKPEWIELSKLHKIKFYNSVDSLQIIQKAIASLKD